MASKSKFLVNDELHENTGRIPRKRGLPKIDTKKNRPEILNGRGDGVDIPPGIQGGEYLVRGGKFEALEGNWQPARLAMLRFPSYEQAKAFYDSEQYRQARAQREGATDFFNLVLVEDGAVIAGGWGVPIAWDGSAGDLPGGWDETLERAVRGLEEQRRLDTLSTMAAEVTALAIVNAAWAAEDAGGLPCARSFWSARHAP